MHPSFELGLSVDAPFDGATSTLAGKQVRLATLFGRAFERGGRRPCSGARMTGRILHRKWAAGLLVTRRCSPDYRREGVVGLDRWKGPRPTRASVPLSGPQAALPV